MAILPIRGVPKSGVNFARAIPSEVEGAVYWSETETLAK